MTNKCKICPACAEQNNPTFIRCWKCGVDFETGQLPPQKSQAAVNGSKDSKKPLCYLWFLAGFFVLQSLSALQRDFISSHRYADFDAWGADFIPASLGLMLASIINSLIIYGIYRFIVWIGKTKK